VGRIPLACADFSFPLLPHTVALDLIASLGIEGVDISLILSNAHLPVEEVLANPPLWAPRVSAMFAERALAMADVNFTPGRNFETRSVNHPDAQVRREARELFYRALEFTVRANGKHITMLPGTCWPAEDGETSLKRSADELAWRVADAAKVGVTLSIEAHLGSIVPTPSEAVRLLALTPGLTLTLDYTHFVYQGFSDADCEALLPHASHLHARGGRQGRLQAPMKESTIDYARVLNAMKAVNYTGYFAIEYVWIDWEHCNEVDNISETVLMRDLANKSR
jgi:sugar phosphate isomerase/epimerase